MHTIVENLSHDPCGTLTAVALLLCCGKYAVRDRENLKWTGFGLGGLMALFALLYELVWSFPSSYMFYMVVILCGTCTGASWILLRVGEDVNRRFQVRSARIATDRAEMRRKEQETKPVREELARLIEAEKDDLIQHANQTMELRLQRAKLIPDPLMREHEEAQARKDFAKTMREVNAT